MNTCSMVGIRTMSLLEPSQKTLVKLLDQFLVGGIGNNSVKLKFIYSEKATKFCEIFTLLLSYVLPVKSKVKISQNFVASQNI